MAISTGTVQQNVIKALGMNYSDTVLQARALRWLNKALDRIQMYIPEAEFLQVADMPLTLVVDQATYVLPSDFFQLLSLRNDTEGTIIYPMDRRDFDKAHPDPSSEDSGVPSDLTLEYDRTDARHVMRIAPPADSADVCYATMRRWHSTLASGTNLLYDKLELALENGGIYEGSMEIYADQEYAQLRGEYKQNFLETTQALTQVMSVQKPRSAQIPVIMSRSNYSPNWQIGG